MATRDELAIKYNQQYALMHDEFYETINKERLLRQDKTVADLNLCNAEITQNYEAELIANGFPSLNPPPELARDLAAEIDDLKAKIKILESR